ncbi:MAG TPA: DUF1648 domain-containing protein [Candidatus Cybelea sp.]|jgi:uncharacterized membrane protein
MATVFLLLGAAIIGVTAILTSQRYADLPDRIPIHFGIDGIVNGYGPRYMAWLMVVVQLAIAILALINYERTGRVGGLAFFNSILAICLATQILILNAARSGKTRVNRLSFWIFFALMLTLGVLAVSKL